VTLPEYLADLLHSRIHVCGIGDVEHDLIATRRSQINW
jgi:hypothetical protein